MKVLFFAMHRKDRVPGQRFRFEQYFEYLEENGVQCELSYLISEDDDKYFYKQGHVLAKISLLFRSLMKRYKETRRIEQYDAVYIAREAFFLGGPFFEKMIAKKDVKLFFDFDDAVWIHGVSKGNRLAGIFRNAGKINKILPIADTVVSGNQFLADYASKFNENIVIFPTTIDTNVYVKKNNMAQKDSILIGWSGSFSTIKHFEIIIPVLSRIKKRYGEKIQFKVIGDGNFECKDLDIIGFPWRLDTEVEELSTFDIGVMPLPNDVWSKGKCGLKGLQYMSLGIPTLMSPVGVNSEIIDDGFNGFLPRNEDEWFVRISELVKSKELRNDVGEKGRQTVEERYSLNANKERFLSLITKLER